MWIIIIIIIAGIIIWAITSNNNDNEKIRQYYNENGGLKMQFPNFVHIMENEYYYYLKFDDGRNICYQKETVNDNLQYGNLNIGIKLDFSNRPIMYSNFTSEGQRVDGQEIVNFTDELKIMEKIIGKSLKNINISS